MNTEGIVFSEAKALSDEGYLPDYVTYTGSWDKIYNNINNYNLPNNSYTFIPFAFTADYPIVAIGIKGNGAVYTGHAYAETIK